MALSTPFLVGDKELSLRFENKQQRDIKANGPTKFFPEAKGLKWKSPMDILNFLGDIDVEIYIIQKGLEWDGSGIEKITETIAADLRQEYLEQGDPDAGEKYEASQSMLADALSLNIIGASGKKLRARGEAEMTKDKDKRVEELAIIYEAQALAKERREQKKILSDSQSES